MSELDWSRLLKEQDEYVHQEDRRQQQRRLKIKMLYKNQLERMIKDHQDHATDEKDQDKRLVKLADQIDRRKIMKEREEALNKQKIKGEMAKDNLKSTYQRRQEMIHQTQQQKKFYVERFKKAKTEVQIESESRIRHRQNQKCQLARAYEIQIRQQQTRKRLEKLQDQKFMKLRQQIEQKKDQTRKQYFDRLRNGYRQNPEVYQHSGYLLMQHQKQKSDFIKKLAQQGKLMASQLQKQKKQERKARETKETSIFNRQYFETKALRQRYQSLQQISQYGAKNKTVQSQLQRQKQKHLQQAQFKKNMLKIELERQIDESHMKNSLRNKMSQKQYLINRGSQMPVLPGISRDYGNQKQHKILQQFLSGSRKRLQFAS